MSTNYEKIQNNPSSGVKFRTIVIFILLAFVGGSIAAGWAITKYDLFQTSSDGLASNELAQDGQTPEGQAQDQNIVIDSNRVNTANGGGQGVRDVTNDPANQNDNVNDQLINERVDSLDDRLSRINVQAQQASGNANRTESMLIAFAARRAIDSGGALGYIENELRLKFARSNPNDVTAIIEAGKKPIRLATLQNELDTASEKLLAPKSEENMWATIKKEMSELFVIRKEGSQPPQPERRLARIKASLTNRDVRTAVAEMKEMPGATNAKEWIEMAERYIRVQNALDAIEKTAISIPTNLGSTNTGINNSGSSNSKPPQQQVQPQNGTGQATQNPNVDNNGPLIPISN